MNAPTHPLVRIGAFVLDANPLESSPTRFHAQVRITRVSDGCLMRSALFPALDAYRTSAKAFEAGLSVGRRLVAVQLAAGEP